MSAPIVNDFDYEDDEEFVPPTEEELKRIEARRKKSDQISAELGRRMLQGWGLMATHCPQEDCFAPLMKEPKTSKLFCVNCNVYVVPEAEYEANKTVSSSAASNASQHPTSSSQTSKSSLSTTQSSSLGSVKPTEHNIPNTSGSSLLQQTTPFKETPIVLNGVSSTNAASVVSTEPFTTTGATTSAPGSSEANPGVAIKNALRLLTLQMQNANLRLQETTPPYEQSMQFLVWYEQCAKTLATLKQAANQFGEL